MFLQGLEQVYNIQASPRMQVISESKWRHPKSKERNLFSENKHETFAQKHGEMEEDQIL